MLVNELEPQGFSFAKKAAAFFNGYGWDLSLSAGRGSMLEPGLGRND
jgi:hypothetical protein